MNLDQLITENRASALRCAYNFLHNAEDAEDCVQRASLNAFRFQHQFNGDCAWRTWFLAIVKRQALMMRREPHSRMLANVVDDSENALLRLAYTYTPEDHAIVSEKLSKVADLISQLSIVRKAGIALAIEQGVGNNSRNKGRILQARKQLRLMMQARGLQELARI